MHVGWLCFAYSASHAAAKQLKKEIKDLTAALASMPLERREQHLNYRHVQLVRMGERMS